jgi:hypothetical protein
MYLYVSHNFRPNISRIYKTDRFNPTTVLCLSQNMTWIFNVKCHGDFSVHWVKVRGNYCVHWVMVRGNYSLCWYCLRCCPSLVKLSFHRCDKTVEQELLTLPQPLSSPPVLSGVHVTRSLVLCVCFVDRCLSFFFWSLCCLFFFNIRILITPLVSSNFGHCVVCSSIYRFWLPLWYLQTLAIVLSVLLQYTDSDYPFGIFKLWPLCCLFFNIQFLIIPLVSSNSSYKKPTNKFISETCLVQTLSTSDQRYLFGYTPDGATGKIFSAGKMLHMVEPRATQVYMGVKSYRGIAVDTWQSCQYWDAYDATMNVTWYFTGMMIYKC